MKLVLLSIVTLVILYGCSTRKKTEVEKFTIDNQTPAITLDAYKDVEDRVGVNSSQQNKNLTVVVAISGGGHRAGNFGVGVLKALENIKYNNKTYDVLKEVDYLSTASGGGIAAGAYIASLYDHNSSEPYSFSKKVLNNTNKIKRNLERGYHNDLAKALIRIKTIGNSDRGDYLEKEFDEKILGAAYRTDSKSITLGDIFIEKDKISLPKFPIWIANATIYENGSIFPFYPAAFEEYGVTQYTHNIEEVNEITDYGQIPLSIGLKASASFPIGIPATTLGSNRDENNGFIHLFDGGLADNLGVSTAIQLLEISKRKKKVLIVVDAYKGNTEPFSKSEGSPTMLQIYNRATSISLDTWRIRHKWLVDNLIKGIKNDGEEIEVIYLSFEQAEKQTKDLVEEITTNFNISSGEQQALFDAAYQVVNLEGNVKKIIRSIFGKE